jgi:cytochrome c biogenesis protein CcmG/thiol:disulfide interchange protein DsbE
VTDPHTDLQADPQTPPQRNRMRLWLAILPLAVFLGLAGLFYMRLGFDASQVPSALIGKTVPKFTLPELAGAGVPGFDDNELRKGKVTLINVFASWCGPCRDEHPLLMHLSKDKALADKGVKIFGLNYKDKAGNALSFLKGLGNPYERIGADTSGRTGIDWGVYGVPETFVVKGDGTIAYKYIGPLSPEGIKTRLLPAIEKALQ